MLPKFYRDTFLPYSHYKLIFGNLYDKKNIFSSIFRINFRAECRKLYMRAVELEASVITVKSTRFSSQYFSYFLSGYVHENAFLPFYKVQNVVLLLIILGKSPLFKIIQVTFRPCWRQKFPCVALFIHDYEEAGRAL